MIKHFADTSALLHQKDLLNPKTNIAISPLTISELEYIKEHEEDKNIRYLAREVVRSIMTDTKFNVIIPDNKVIDRLLKKYSFLSNINDHRILLAAEAAAIQ
jgi:predicted nucleic acid-binding protein